MAVKLVEKIWKLYDKDKSGFLERTEYVKLLKDISKNTNDKSLEKRIHIVLDEYRTAGNKEFFELNLDQAIETVVLEGKNYRD